MDALKANGYPSALFPTFLKIRSHLHEQFLHQKNWDLCFFFKWAGPLDSYQGFACLSDNSGLTEPLTSWENFVIMKFELLANLLKPSSRSFRPQISGNCWFSNVMFYKIPCSDCPRNNIEETGRYFQTRKKRASKKPENYTKGSNNANNAWQITIQSTLIMLV